MSVDAKSDSVHFCLGEGWGACLGRDAAAKGDLDHSAERQVSVGTQDCKGGQDACPIRAGGGRSQHTDVTEQAILFYFLIKISFSV